MDILAGLQIKPEEVVLYIKGCREKYLAAFYYLNSGWNWLICRSDQIIPSDFPTFINALTA